MTATETTELTPELIEQVRRLSPSDRERLFELADGPTGSELAAWRAELLRRIEGVGAGTIVTHTPEDVTRSVREAVAAARRS